MSDYPFDTTGLSQKDLDEARQRAKRRLADQIAEAELGLLDPKKAPIRAGEIPVPDEPQWQITIDLEPNGSTGDRIVLDGKIFMHGGTYTVGERVYRSLCETISRGFGHQKEIEGKINTNAYRRQQNLNAQTLLPTPESIIPPSVRRALDTQ